MRLTNFTDFSIRVLLYAAAHEDRLVTISEIQDTFGLSKGHLMKIVQLLSNEGYIDAVRGRSGGIRLGKPPEDIILGHLIRITEPDFRLVECFGAENKCLISKCCLLPAPLNEALSAFLNTLDRYTLADMALPRSKLSATQGIKFPIRGPEKSIVNPVRSGAQ